MSGGELWGRPYSWWRRNARTVSVDPHQLTVGATPVKRRIVDAYRANPQRRSSDGNKPCVERTWDGRLFVHEGKHRTLAARAEGRRLRVRLVDAREHTNSEREVTAHHEEGHALAGQLAGLSTQVHVGDGHGTCDYSSVTTPAQVHGRQVAALAGGMAEARWRREHGRWGGNRASAGDLASFRRFSTWEGAIPLGRARREARALVDRHWATISQRAAQHFTKAVAR